MRSVAAYLCAECTEEELIAVSNLLSDGRLKEITT